MKEPPPRHSQFSKFYTDNDDVDYNMKSPLGPIVGYPCRNFPAGPTQGTLVAGHPFRVQFDGVANHLGGDCQFAVSYDNGTSFAVIWDKMASCFLDTVNGGYDVPVPDYIPAAKKAIFAWTWINAMGSREYYMNCADVRIENYGHQEPLTAHELLVVNLPGKSTLNPRTGREEDKLPQMMKQRSFVTVGKPIDLVAADEADGRPRHSADDSETSDGLSQQEEADPMANRAEDASGQTTGSSLPDEITSFVFTTRTITDDDDDGDGDGDAAANALDRSFTYSEIEDYRSRSKASNGLTVMGDENEVGEYLGTHRKQPGADAPIPFDVDDTLPLATHRMTGSDSFFDIWPESSASTLAAISIATAETPATRVTAMATQYKTVTINSTPFLQVVVSSNNTAIPSSLTISY
ncbi:hypothetical protein J3B02_004301 [Coemansia erecta]|nr:hypothetical protein J3B02_004301 [Coemansia erecta]